MLKDGDKEKVHYIKDQLTLILHAMFHLALRKLLKIQSQLNKFTIMSRDHVSVKDLDFDFMSNHLYSHKYSAYTSFIMSCHEMP